MDAQEHLLDRDRRPPALLLIQYREADRARGVDVRVEERRHELALRRLAGVVLLRGPPGASRRGGRDHWTPPRHGELHPHFEEAALPVRPLFPGHAGVPAHQVRRAVAARTRPREEAEGVVPPPGLALLAQAAARDARHV